MELKTYDINVKVLRAGYFNGYTIPKGVTQAQRVCYDYELEYYIKSDGGIWCDGKLLPVHAGQVNVRKPGQRVQGVNPYTCYIICFHANGGAQPSDYVFGSPQQAQPRYDNPLLSSLPDRITVEQPAYVGDLFQRVYSAWQQRDDYHVFRANQLLATLLAELFRQQRPQAGQPMHPRVLQAVNRIREDFTQPLEVARLVGESGLSAAYFHKCFKQHVGMTPLELVVSLRMDMAKELLCITDSPVADVAMACGYDDPVYFTYLFRRQVGQSPSAYRKQRAVDRFYDPAGE